jgi:hypothetical protein
VVRHNDTDRVFELMLPPDAITRLALEAQFRNTRIDKLLGDLITATTKRDLFRQVLNDASRVADSVFLPRSR